MENKRTGFRIGMDDETIGGVVRAGGEPLYSGQRDPRRIDLINRRITLFSILIPLLVAVMLVAAYVAVATGMVNVGSGSTAALAEVAERLNAIDAKLEEVAARIETVESAAANDRGTPIDEFALVFQETIDGLKVSMKSLEDQLVALKGGKVDLIALDEYKETVADRLKGATDEIAAIREEIGAFRKGLTEATEKREERLAALEETVAPLAESIAPIADKIAPLTENLEISQEQVKGMKAEVEQLRKEMIAELGSVMDAKGVRRIVSASVGDLGKQIESLKGSLAAERRNVEQLKRSVETLETTVRSLSRAQRLGTPQPGTVLEQDIQ